MKPGHTACAQPPRRQRLGRYAAKTAHVICAAQVHAVHGQCGCGGDLAGDEAGGRRSVAVVVADGSILEETSSECPSEVDMFDEMFERV